MGKLLGGIAAWWGHLTWRAEVGQGSGLSQCWLWEVKMIFSAPWKGSGGIAAIT